MLFEVRKIDEKEFEKITKKHPEKQFFIEQSPTWNKFDNAITDRKPLGVYGFYENNQITALAALTVYFEKMRNWIWIKKGPIWLKTPTLEDEKKLLQTLSQQFTNIKISEKKIQPLFIRLYLQNPPPKNIQPPFEHTMYEKTVIIDLTQIDENNDIASFPTKTRRKIRKSITNGIETKQIKENREKIFQEQCYPILQETAQRSKFRAHNSNIYETMLKTLPNNTLLYAAYYENKIVAWTIISEYKQQALYYYAAGNTQARKTFAAYNLQFTVIKDLKKRGNKIYDLMGIASENYPELANVTEFKTSISKNIIKLPTSYDYPISKTKYQIINKTLLLRRKLLYKK